ncbi:MAG: mercuric reductase [Planctomycetes bacterium]|nr:mercuric reductase [Planctomycetota bacterium]
MTEKTTTESQRRGASLIEAEAKDGVEVSEESITREFPQARPFDKHNQALMANVHPTDWTNPQPSGRYNMVVIGGGTAGLVTAAGAAGLGAKVALIERALLGGDCLNVGCVPSKALIRCARAFAEVRDAGAFGVTVPDGATVDFGSVMERMRKLRADISPNDSAKRFRELGIDVFIGDACFTGRDTVEVDGKTLRFSRACIATGARAAPLPIPGLAEAGYLTNETIFSLTELPRRMAIIGAGPIGCEMAQTFARFGTEVTLVEAMHQLLAREDQDAAQRIEQALVRDGVRINCCAKITGVRKEGDETILTLEGETGGELVVDAVLVSVGRAPNVDGLGLEVAGVEFDTRQGVKVDDRLRTTNSRIFAAGDICSPYKFTHAADFMARIVIQNALFFGRSKASALTIPWCTFTDPEIAHVGLYEQQARDKGIAVETFTVEMSDVDRALLDGEADGFLKVHVAKGSDKILGATLVARHAGEMISEITLAMVSGAGLSALAKTIHPYPTQAEVIRKAGDAYNRTRLTPRVKKLFDTLMRWKR